MCGPDDVLVCLLVACCMSVLFCLWPSLVPCGMPEWQVGLGRGQGGGDLVRWPGNPAPAIRSWGGRGRGTSAVQVLLACADEMEEESGDALGRVPTRAEHA